MSATPNGEPAAKKAKVAPVKVIIDTDPGVDDAMAIIMAFNSPDLDVIGLTSIYGNVPTKMATSNAIFLRDFAGRSDVPVAPGSEVSSLGAPKVRIADFVHGKDGFGNTNIHTDHESTKGKELGCSAAEFMVQQCAAAPGEVVIVATGALTNVDAAIKMDPELPKKWKQLMVLGGAMFVNGNVNPASEANMFGDPEAADFVFKHALNTRMVGLDVTHKCVLTAEDLEAMVGVGKHGTFIRDIAQFYLGYHNDSYNNMNGVFVHDPAAVMAVADPSLFTWTAGGVCVVCGDGPSRGHTIMDAGLKVWNGPNEWIARPKVEVATAVDSKRLVEQVKKRLTAA